MQAENICYKSRDSGFGVINLKQEGLIRGIKLEHVSGKLTCDIFHSYRANLWGCNSRTKSNEAVLSTVITDADNQVVFPANSNSSKVITVPGFNAAVSHVLVFTNFVYPNYFDKGQELRIWYNSDLLDFTEFDNGGIHCVNVYATIQRKIYKK